MNHIFSVKVKLNSRWTIFKIKKSPNAPVNWRTCTCKFEVDFCSVNQVFCINFTKSTLKEQRITHGLYIITIPHYLSSLISYVTICIWWILKIARCPRAQSTLNWGKPYRCCTERSLYIVNVLRLSCTTRCLGALRRLLATTLYVLYSLALPNKACTLSVVITKLNQLQSTWQYNNKICGSFLFILEIKYLPPSLL